MNSVSATLGEELLGPDAMAGQTLLDSPDQLLDLLPAAVYVCDRSGRILRYNRRAAEIWGRAPRIGDPAERFCGSLRMYRLDGGALPHGECPMADALRSGIPVRDQEVVIERPGGERRTALVNIEVMRDGVGTILGAINCFQDITERRLARAAQSARERQWHQILQGLPVAVYMTDAQGRITFYNDAAADLWGVRPDIGTSAYCGSWKLYWPDGTPLAHDECPMALALREGRPNCGMEAVAERPDGTRVPFLPYPMPLWDEDGELIGALNTLVDISEHKRREDTAQRLASVVESSHDAIVSKDLNGVITSWNRSAERLFGYKAEEVVGKPITILIPEERHDEERTILERIGRGEQVEHFETIRRRKDGSLVELSLTISPIRNARGEVTGASKIARDITERRQAEEQKNLLLREMNHRAKNLLTVASGLVTLGARSQGTREELVRTLQGRLSALARAHQLTLPDLTNGDTGAAAATTLGALLEAIFSPFVIGDDGDDMRIVSSGPDVPVSGHAVTSVALLLHEFATNAAKHGALSSPAGRVRVEWTTRADELVLTWSEKDGPVIAGEPESEGFGSLLARGVTSQLGGRISRDWLAEGLLIRLTLPLERIRA